MKLYLDNSFLNRPFDEQTVGKNSLESEILQVVLQLVRSKEVFIINSAVIQYENSLNPVLERKLFIEQEMKYTKNFQNITPEIEKRATQLVIRHKLKPIDALHCAAAEAAQADFLITCDYELARKYAGPIKVVEPLTFAYHYYYG